MTPALHATLVKKGARWFDRMKNCVVDIGHGHVAKVIALCAKDGGVNERGIWWNDEQGSTHIRSWEHVDRDLNA